MNVFRYVIDHDMGFSPNPFHGVCTLANCKPKIRNKAQPGDFVLGFGSAKSNIRRRLIYWMRIGRVLTFDEYWIDPAYERKKAIVNGSHIKFHGDNIYHTNDEGTVLQEPSFHSLPDGTPNLRNVERDTGSTNRVLVADIFGYYGKHALPVPECMAEVIAVGRGHRTRITEELRDAVIEWLIDSTPRGFYGEPSDWRKIPK